MEEEEKDTIIMIDGGNSMRSVSNPSIYRSIQSNLNHADSQQTVYHSVRNTVYEDAISMDSVDGAGDRNNYYESENSTLRGTHETLIDDNFHDVRIQEQKTNPLLPEINETGLNFRDGVRSIDFVLVWDEQDAQSLTFRSNEFRKVFEENLNREGLDLEYEDTEPSGLRFIKIHAPREVLRRYSEILKLRLPMKEIKSKKKNESSPRSNAIIEEVNGCIDNFMKKFYVDEKIFPTMKHKFTAIYSRDKEYLFDSDNNPDFFTPATRSKIVQFILDRTKFTENKEDDFAFGVDRLISEHAYVAAYPLHDGDLRTPGSMRHLLYTHWASLSKWYHYQPLDYIKDYFGVKIGLYFAWLGFYTCMLLPASVVGLLCFAYGWITLYDNKPSEDICNSNSSIDMCPLCDHFCSYWDLRETCLHGRLTYLFDNSSTVIFAGFMSLWATLFLEFWKKYSAEITHRWDLTGLDIQDEYPRPHYLARLSHIKKTTENVVTKKTEPIVPFWSMKLPAKIISFSVVLLLISIAMASVIGVVFYRMALLTSMRLWGNSAITSNAILFTTATAACLNLCCIFVFNWLYVWLAEVLTERELLRTQTEFDDSLTLKIYLLQFVNYYASIFYIAFFKGKFIGYPSTYNRFFNHRQEECGPGGCLTELCIQLSIIMIGKQVMNSFLEMMEPLFYKWINTLKVHMKPKNSMNDNCNNNVNINNTNQQQRSTKKYSPWVRDYKLVEWGPRALLPEYLEMIVQFGFVTIFVAAFPLAPLFALLNNVFEMRLDAKKLLKMYRRPVIQRVHDIGIWYRILDSIAKLSVITNAFIIAFTSNFIPKIIYQLTVSDNRTLDGFLEYSLSTFNTSEFERDTGPVYDANKHIEICRYPDFREPANSIDKYKYTQFFWWILAARLGFVVFFENFVAVVMILVRWCVPDMSESLRSDIRREAYLTNKTIIQHEAERALLRTNSNESVIVRRESHRNENADRLNRVMRDSMSETDFDLEVHGAPVSSTAPTGLLQ